ncbi:NAD(P)H nitroreductase [Pseudomonas putida SJTE-1]|uniref:Nitroreductase n=1 Tax=Pseudomonas putida ND6 TaxID=231023 RepID=I3V4L0_PSEPU|nr:nitroreductase family protein [Pseudomonas putida]AFK72681.1 nitroreductase [Pseudomonas putida ND6]ANI03681.1 NAD(P)H nitroreductase [Pseudomonas putida SJTE-1]
MSTIVQAIRSRTSVNQYDTERRLTDQEIANLVELATLAPSAFNSQNWRFLAVRSPEGKARLLPLAFGQQKVVDAAVTFIVCGTLAPHKSLPHALEPARTAGIIDQSVYDMWVQAATGMYQDNLQLQRDEAIRSGSLAAMTLMLAAQGQGLASTPMIGFDATEVAKAFGLTANDVPVMLVTVGYPGASNWPQKPRKAVQEVLELV